MRPGDIHTMHTAPTTSRGIHFDNLIGLITHLIILSHVHPASDYSLAGSDSLVMPVKDDGDGK